MAGTGLRAADQFRLFRLGLAKHDNSDFRVNLTPEMDVQIPPSHWPEAVNGPTTQAYLKAGTV